MVRGKVVVVGFLWFFTAVEIPHNFCVFGQAHPFYKSFALNRIRAGILASNGVSS